VAERSGKGLSCILRVMSETENVLGRLETDALSALYQGCIGRAEALARGLTGDRQLAQDIAQEAFVRAAGRVIHLRDPSAFDAYLRRTVVNLCKAHFRRRGVEHRGLQRSAVPEEMAPGHQFEERDALWTALLRLPLRQRAALVLRFYEDLSEDQTAAVLRCSARAVNALVSRGMTAMRIGLKEEP
jgi:RNA polymerase sigma factor (sigma-70 family)